MPWRERFLELAPERADALLPAGVPRVVVEAGVPQGWEGLAGSDGRILGLTRFGASAPGDQVMERLGFTLEVIAQAARDVCERRDHDLSPTSDRCPRW